MRCPAYEPDKKREIQTEDNLQCVIKVMVIRSELFREHVVIDYNPRVDLCTRSQAPDEAAAKCLSAPPI
jgi:hypothetical protein